jgi:hypothetical protein
MCQCSIFNLSGTILPLFDGFKTKMSVCETQTDIFMKKSINGNYKTYLIKYFIPKLTPNDAVYVSLLIPIPGKTV